MDGEGNVNANGIDPEGNYEYVAPNGAKLQISKDNDLTIVDDKGNSKTYTEKEVKDMVAKHEAEAAKQAAEASDAATTGNAPQPERRQ